MPRPARDPAVVRAAAAVVPGPAGAAAARGRPTSSRWRCGCPGALDRAALAARAATIWSRGTRACARSSRTGDGRAAAGSPAPRGAACRLEIAARSTRRGFAAALTAAAGARLRPVAASCRCGRSCSRLAAATTTCCCWCCTTSPATAGRWRRWSRDLAARLRGPARGRGAAAGRRCRCSTPTTRCGSGELLGDEDDPDSVWRGSSPTGASALAGLPRASWSCRPTGRARRCRATAAAPVAVRRSPPDLHARLAGAGARARGATLFMVLQAALAALLSRLGAGTDIADRHRRRRAAPTRRSTTWSASSSTPWCCAPTLSGDPTFARAAGPGRGRPTWPRYAHQDVPFERLVEVLNPARSLGAPPAVPGDAGAAERRGRRRAATLPGARRVGPGRRPARRREVRPDRRLSSDCDGRRRARPASTGGCEYATDLFDAATVERARRPAACGCSRRRSRRPGRRRSATCRPARARPSGTGSLARRGTTPRAACRGATAAASCSRRRRRATPDAVAVVFEGRRADVRRARRAGQPAGAAAASARASGPECAGGGVRWSASLELVVGAARRC